MKDANANRAQWQLQVCNGDRDDGVFVRAKIDDVGWSIL